MAVILIGVILGYILRNTSRRPIINNPAVMTGETSVASEKSETDSDALTLPAVQSSIEETNALPVFAFTTKEWVAVQNKLNNEVGIPTLNYDNIAMQNKQFTINQSEYMFYLGRFNDGGGIYTIMLGGFGDGSTESGYEITLSMALLVAAIHPEYTREQFGAVIGELGVLSDERPDEMNLIKDGTTYTFLNDPELGLMLFVSPSA